MSSDVKDPAQEFAERVADQWCIGTNMEGEQARLPGYDSLVDLIATELRSWTEQQVKQIEDDTAMLLSKMKSLPPSP